MAGLPAVWGLPRVEIDEDDYCELHDHGFELKFTSDGRLEAFFLFAEGVIEGQRVTRFAGDLPSGLRFDMTREDVRRHLGPPDRHSDKRGKWSRPYDAWGASVELHVTYSDTLERILLVTIQTSAE